MIPSASSSNTTVEAVLTCPACGHRASETMPVDACVFFWQCPHCEQRLRPKEGDCCVFCSYGDTPCPSVQEASLSPEDEPPCCG